MSKSFKNAKSVSETDIGRRKLPVVQFILKSLPGKIFLKIEEEFQKKNRFFKDYDFNSNTVCVSGSKKF